MPKVFMLSIVMLSVIMLSVVMLNVIMLNIVMPSVVAPHQHRRNVGTSATQQGILKGKVPLYH